MVRVNVEIRRLLVLVLFTIIFLTWVFINLAGRDVSYLTGAIFLGLSVFSFIFLLGWDNVKKISKNPKHKLNGLDDNWLGDFLIRGIPVGILIMAIVGIFPAFTLFAPDLPASSVFSSDSSIGFFVSVGQFLVVSVISPIVEEVFFRVVIFALFFTIIGFGFWITSIITSAIFSAYHIYVYAGELSWTAISAVQSNFISAFLFGMVACILIKWTGSVSSSIGMHGTVNTIIDLPQMIAF